MSRQCRHIEEYSEEILRLKAEEKTRAEIGKQLEMENELMWDFLSLTERK